MADGPELFESAWLKWSWAVAHSKGLDAYIAAWRVHPNRKTDFGYAGHYDAKHHRIDVYVTHVDPLPIEWGLVLGDIAHNYRSLLDHIAWALVERGRTPPATLSEWDRGGIYFPIYPLRLAFNDALNRKLPGVRRTDRAVVRRYQPYHEGERRRPNHALAVLHRLSNDDKHRTVQPALAAPRAVSYDIADERDCTITRIPASMVLWEPLQVGTKLAPIYVRRTGPNPDVHMDCRLTAEPILQQGVWLAEWLQAMPGITSNLLGELSDPPTELLTKLDAGFVDITPPTLS